MNYTSYDSLPKSFSVTEQISQWGGRLLALLLGWLCPRLLGKSGLRAVATPSSSCWTSLSCASGRYCWEMCLLGTTEQAGCGVKYAGRHAVISCMISQRVNESSFGFFLLHVLAKPEVLCY